MVKWPLDWKRAIIGAKLPLISADWKLKPNRSMIAPRTLGILVGMVALVGCERMKSAEVRFSRVTSSFNPKNLEFCNFRITPGSGGRLIELSSNLLRNISTEVHLAVEFSLRNRQDGSWKQIFSYDFDMCKMWEGLMRRSMARTWLKNLKKFSNFPTSCPVQRGYYYIKKMKVHKKSIPMFITSGQYMANMVLYFKRGAVNDWLTNSSMEAEVIKERSLADSYKKIW